MSGRFQLVVDTAETTYIMRGDVGGGQGDAARDLDVNWRTWAVEQPDAVFRLAGPDGPVDVLCGQITGVRLTVGDDL